MSEQKVKPVLPGGFRDYLPELQIQRARIIRQIQTIYELFGYDPLEAPCIERTDVLTGDRESLESILYRAFAARGGRGLPDPDTPSLALRFDLTVSLARIVAASPELAKPFKRYQTGNAWRGEKPQLGRFREFLQFDADIVGSSSMLADAEMVTMMDAVMRTLGFTRFVTRINNRKVLNGLASRGGFDTPPEKAIDVIRVLDKIDKIGKDAVLKELADDVGLDAQQVALVTQYLEIGGTNDEVLDKLGGLLADVPIGAEGVDELKQIATALRDAGVPEDGWRMDPSIARGLGYYTGPVWEMVLLDAPEIGTVYAGGRYDGLIGRFMPDAAVPCTGTSAGVDRLFAGMEKLGMLTPTKTVADVMITSFSPEMSADYQKMAAGLRGRGVRTIVYMGEDTSFKAQISYASRQEIPVVLIYGPDDRDQGVVQVKNMLARKQTPAPLDQVTDRVCELLEELKSST